MLAYAAIDKMFGLLIPPPYLVGTCVVYDIPVRAWKRLPRHVLVTLAVQVVVLVCVAALW